MLCNVHFPIHFWSIFFVNQHKDITLHVIDQKLHMKAWSLERKKDFQ
jgi:hypothetical protein